MDVCNFIEARTLRPQYFGVVVNVIEAKNLAWRQPDSFVMIKLGREYRITGIQRNTDKPFYNQFFTFDFFLPLNDLLEKRLTIGVHMGSRKSCFFKKMLGSIRMDLGFVWFQKHHQFYHKWAILTHPKKNSPQVQGHLKLDIAILEKGDFIRTPYYIKDTYDVEKNLLHPCALDDMTPSIGRYRISLYSGCDFRSQFKTVLTVNPDFTYSGKISVSVAFAGHQMSTAAVKNQKNVYWNEQFTFTESYPPMFQLIKISVKINDDVVCTRVIFMKDIWNCNLKGFLPSFGPAYVHFYDKDRFYQGSVFLAIKSEQADTPLLPHHKLTSVQKHLLSGFHENEDFLRTDYIIFGVIFEASVVRENLCPGKDIVFTISMGTEGTSVIQNEDSFNTTLAMECVPNNEGIFSLKIGKFKPCLFLRTSWPDFRHRFFLSNIIDKMALMMKKSLSSAQKQMCIGNAALAHEQLNKMMEELLLLCSKNVSLPVGKTTLDRARVSSFKALLESIVKSMPAFHWKAPLNEKFHRACNILFHIEQLIEEPQEIFPDIILNLWKSEQLISNFRIPARDLLQGDFDNRSGKLSGKLLTLFLKPLKEKTKLEMNGKVDIFLWLGPVANIGKCLELIPEGSEDLSKIIELPRYIRYPNKIIFQCRAYIYQGQFELKNSRIDKFSPAVRIIMGSESKTTQTVKYSITPIWDEMLVFNKIVLYRGRNYLQKHPPSVVIELLNRSKGKDKLIGVANTLPVVRLLTDSNSFSGKKIKMDWHNIYDSFNKKIGEILALFEYSEISPLHEDLSVPEIVEDLPLENFSGKNKKLIHAPTVNNLGSKEISILGKPSGKTGTAQGSKSGPAPLKRDTSLNRESHENTVFTGQKSNKNELIDNASNAPFLGEFSGKKKSREALSNASNEEVKSFSNILNNKSSAVEKSSDKVYNIVNRDRQSMNDERGKTSILHPLTFSKSKSFEERKSGGSDSYSLTKDGVSTNDTTCRKFKEPFELPGPSQEEVKSQKKVTFSKKDQSLQKRDWGAEYFAASEYKVRGFSNSCRIEEDLHFIHCKNYRKPRMLQSSFFSDSSRKKELHISDTCKVRNSILLNKCKNDQIYQENSNYVGTRIHQTTRGPENQMLLRGCSKAHKTATRTNDEHSVGKKGVTKQLDTFFSKDGKQQRTGTCEVRGNRFLKNDNVNDGIENLSIVAPFDSFKGKERPGKCYYSVSEARLSENEMGKSVKQGRLLLKDMDNIGIREVFEFPSFCSAMMKKSPNEIVYLTPENALSFEKKGTSETTVKGHGKFNEIFTSITPNSLGTRTLPYQDIHCTSDAASNVRGQSFEKTSINNKGNRRSNQVSEITANLSKGKRIQENAFCPVSEDILSESDVVEEKWKPFSMVTGNRDFREFLFWLWGNQSKKLPSSAIPAINSHKSNDIAIMQNKKESGLPNQELSYSVHGSNVTHPQNKQSFKSKVNFKKKFKQPNLKIFQRFDTGKNAIKFAVDSENSVKAHEAKITDNFDSSLTENNLERHPEKSSDSKRFRSGGSFFENNGILNSSSREDSTAFERNADEELKIDEPSTAVKVNRDIKEFIRWLSEKPKNLEKAAPILDESVSVETLHNQSNIKPDASRKMTLTPTNVHVAAQVDSNNSQTLHDSELTEIVIPANSKPISTNKDPSPGRGRDFAAKPNKKNLALPLPLAVKLDKDRVVKMKTLHTRDGLIHPEIRKGKNPKFKRKRKFFKKKSKPKLYLNSKKENSTLNLKNRKDGAKARSSKKKDVTESNSSKRKGGVKSISTKGEDVTDASSKKKKTGAKSYSKKPEDPTELNPSQRNYTRKPVLSKSAIPKNTMDLAAENLKHFLKKPKSTEILISSNSESKNSDDSSLLETNVNSAENTGVKNVEIPLTSTSKAAKLEGMNSKTFQTKNGLVPSNVKKSAISKFKKVKNSFKEKLKPKLIGSKSKTVAKTNSRKIIPLIPKNSQKLNQILSTYSHPHKKPKLTEIFPPRKDQSEINDKNVNKNLDEVTEWNDIHLPLPQMTKFGKNRVVKMKGLHTKDGLITSKAGKNENSKSSGRKNSSKKKHSNMYKKIIKAEKLRSRKQSKIREKEKLKKSSPNSHSSSDSSKNFGFKKLKNKSYSPVTKLKGVKSAILNWSNKLKGYEELEKRQESRENVMFSAKTPPGQINSTKNKSSESAKRISLRREYFHLNASDTSSLQSENDGGSSSVSDDLSHKESWSTETLKLKNEINSVSKNQVRPKKLRHILGQFQRKMKNGNLPKNPHPLSYSESDSQSSDSGVEDKKLSDRQGIFFKRSPSKKVSFAHRSIKSKNGKKNNLKSKTPDISLKQNLSQENLIHKIVKTNPSRGNSLNRSSSFLSEFKEGLNSSYDGSSSVVLSDSFEASESEDFPIISSANILRIPQGIRPEMQAYVLEILFWGLRNVKLRLRNPSISFTMAGYSVESKQISNVRSFPNFNQGLSKISVELPVENLYFPSAVIKLFSHDLLERRHLRGFYVIKNLSHFKTNLIRMEDWNEERNTYKILLNKNHIPSSGTEEEAEIEIDPLIVHKESIEYKEEPISFNVHVYPKIDAALGAIYHFIKDIMFSIGHFVSSLDRSLQNFLLYYVLRIVFRVLLFYLMMIGSYFSWFYAPFVKLYFNAADLVVDDDDEEVTSEESSELEFKEEESFEDWWAGYYDSLALMGDMKKKKLWLEGSKTVFVCDCCKDVPFECRSTSRISRIEAPLMIYNHELEQQPEFQEFQDVLKNFTLQSSDVFPCVDHKSQITTTFKGAISISPPVSENQFVTAYGNDASSGILRDHFSNKKQSVIVRVYVVRALNLHSQDPNLLADAYINIFLGKRKVASNRSEYVAADLHPIFGKCFEIEAKFPRDAMLTVQLMDFDKITSDDLIGETTIDLESRFYSKHRGSCGLSQAYNTTGPRIWRDSTKPTEILEKLCEKYQALGPTYYHSSVVINSKQFFVDRVTRENVEDVKENLALVVLRRWHELPLIGCCLVPEHVETRCLFRSDKPGVEQGRIEMWVDMFAKEFGTVMRPPLNIERRKPLEMQLRVSVFNTANVALKDEPFFSDRHSDIYVLGWLIGKVDTQRTDIHYYSLTGDGNFNWRFIFNFYWMPSEKMIRVYEEKKRFHHATEYQIPPRLHLQVWDHDKILKDDFIDLMRVPKPARTRHTCTLETVSKYAQTVNLFTHKKLHGWWPFTDVSKKNRNEKVFTGMVEVELELVTMQEAKKHPVGYGHDEPNALPPPDRPEVAWNYFTGVFGIFYYFLIPTMWRHKGKILTFVATFALVYFIVLFVYAFPGYAAKRFVGA